MAGSPSSYRSWRRCPAIFSGGMTLGGLMMVVGAFNQVQVVVALVRRPVSLDCRLARHAASRQRVQGGDRKARRDRRGGRYDRRWRRHPEEHPGYSRELASCSRTARSSLLRPRSISAWRARADRRQIRHRQEHAVPRACRSLAVGERHASAARSRRDHVHAATAIPAARHDACGDSLSRRAADAFGTADVAAAIARRH